MIIIIQISIEGKIIADITRFASNENACGRKFSLLLIADHGGR